MRISSTDQFRNNYYLSPHIAACCTADYVVLLDCRKNRYLGVSAAEARILATCVNNFPNPADCTAPALPQSPSCTELLRSMMTSGIITSGNITEMPNRRGSIEAPKIELIEGYAEVQFELTFSDLMQFVLSSLTAQFYIRFCSLEAVTKRITNRRAHAGVKPELRYSPLDLERARILVAKFDRICRLLFSGRDACLFRTFALYEFLSRHRFFPCCVFGVTTNPFTAHCWLQHREIVFNDTCGNAGNFTPILVI